MENKLSAVVITFNEERNIARCIESLLPIADEIVVLDSFSSDNTQTICEKYPVRFVQHAWQGYAASKNYANSLVMHDFIFSVDADEAPDEKLQQAILREKQTGFRGRYAVNRLTNYCGHWIRHSGWYPDIKTRIFDRRVTHWTGEFVHETLVHTDPADETILEGHLLHYSYYSFRDHRARADKYSALTAQKMHAAGKKASVLKPWLSAIGRFIAMYVIKKGFLDGKMGWKIAQISAASNVYKYRELRRLNREQE